MLNKFVMTTLSVIGLSVSVAAFAENMDSCKVQVAVATPPVQADESVAFNVSSESGINRSLTLKGGSAPQMIEKLPCATNSAYTVTATQYSTPSNDLLFQLQGIGQCTLKAGQFLLSAPGNSVSVVFPNDFICNN